LPFYFEKHYNYVNDVFPQFIKQKSKKSETTDILTENEQFEKTDSSYFYKLLLINFLNANGNFVDISKKIEKIFIITGKFKNNQNIFDIFVNKMSKYLWKVILIQKDLADGSQINYCSIIKIMRGIFKLQEIYSNIGKELTLFFNLIKFYCLILLPIHLFEDEFSEIVESKKIINFLSIILTSSIDFQNYILDQNQNYSNYLLISKNISVLCKEILSNPSKLNNYNERKQFFSLYKDSMKNLNFFASIQENISNFPKDLRSKNIVLLEPANNLEDSIEIDSKFIAKLDIVFDIYNMEVLL